MRTDNTLQQMTGKSGMESLQEQQLAELVRLGRMYLKEHGASQEQSAAYIDAVKAAEETSGPRGRAMPRRQRGSASGISAEMASNRITRRR